MAWSRWIRQVHRWTTVVFTLAVMANGVAVARGRYSARMGLMAVLPLAVLFLTGAYLFVLPYASRLRRGRLAAEGGERPEAGAR